MYLVDVNKYCTEYSSSEVEEILFADTKRASNNMDDVSEELKKLLKIKNRMSIFKSIEDGDIIHIVKDVEFKKFKKDEPIVQEGETSSFMYFIVLGECEIVINSSKGKQVCVGYLKSGEVFGEIAAVFSTKRIATIYSSKDGTTLLRISINFDVFKQHPLVFAQLYKNVAFELTQKLDNANKRNS